LVFIVAFSSCSKKDDINDNTKKNDPVDSTQINSATWVGTYNGQSGQAIQRVIVEIVDSSTIKMQLQAPFNSSFVTYATIGGAKITSTTNVTINEDGLIYGSSDTYSFTGSGNLNGNTLTISGNAASKTNALDVKPYYFTGSK